MPVRPPAPPPLAVCDGAPRPRHPRPGRFKAIQPSRSVAKPNAERSPRPTRRPTLSPNGATPRPTVDPGPAAAVHRPAAPLDRRATARSPVRSDVAIWLPAGTVVPHPSPGCPPNGPSPIDLPTEKGLMAAAAVFPVRCGHPPLQSHLGPGATVRSSGASLRLLACPTPPALSSSPDLRGVVGPRQPSALSDVASHRPVQVASVWGHRLAGWASPGLFGRRPVRRPPARRCRLTSWL